MSYCYRCGKELKQRAKFCGSCGTDVASLQVTGSDVFYGKGPKSIGVKEKPRYSGKLKLVNGSNKPRQKALRREFQTTEAWFVCSAFVVDASGRKSGSYEWVLCDDVHGTMCIAITNRQSSTKETIDRSYYLHYDDISSISIDVIRCDPLEGVTVTLGLRDSDQKIIVDISGQLKPTKGTPAYEALVSRTQKLTSFLNERRVHYDVYTGLKTKPVGPVSKSSLPNFEAIYPRLRREWKSFVKECKLQETKSCKLQTLARQCGLTKTETDAQESMLADFVSNGNVIKNKITVVVNGKVWVKANRQEVDPQNNTFKYYEAKLFEDETVYTTYMLKSSHITGAVIESECSKHFTKDSNLSVGFLGRSTVVGTTRTRRDFMALDRLDVVLMADSPNTKVYYHFLGNNEIKELDTKECNNLIKRAENFRDSLNSLAARNGRAVAADVSRTSSTVSSPMLPGLTPGIIQAAEQETEQTQEQQKQQSQQLSIEEQLMSYKRLFDAGVIDEDEFKLAKKKLLGI